MTIYKSANFTIRFGHLHNECCNINSMRCITIMLTHRFDELCDIYNNTSTSFALVEVKISEHIGSNTESMMHHYLT